ncbi:hypothetical protein COW81_01985 [Candidatus Campbellbacteria bacterium CG22_combo_CG10-13_8_21_14_all_36_13]|uniref:DUF8128 domain-containing protein n=1 Tax=Candidatus Campbellbacteria bacterium CG22_combo_CG10-13_8_21_14_all_36_13 TaxID=1974529 RepID=A0A2H0DY64_9BACT|nr:MAG: hypothetical protein COW81_01985 [Candidatus Campbellbacteria bacterium CG22_combo_CG10-13_8_21_14_all_36_13]
MTEWIYAYLSQVVFPSIFDGLYFAAPIALPLIFGVLFLNIWLDYVRAETIRKTKNVLLEIKLPKEQMKSPLAMELALNALHQSGPGASTWYDVYWKGGIKPWFSLELVSIGGDIHFFIWTRVSNRSYVESQIYAQYPNVEILEVEDYTNFIKHDKENLTVWGCEMTLVKNDAYPIKTYVDYGLDKNPKEEEKIDPMTPMIEFLGALDPGEQVWYQIVVQFHKNRNKKPSSIWEYFFPKETDWKKDAQKVIDEILKRDPKTKTSTEKVEDKPQITIISDGEKEVAKAIERSIAKNGFDVGIRALYFAEEGRFNGMNIGGMIGSWKQYGSNDLNGFKPTRGLIPFNYPWQDFRNIRKNRVKVALFDAYRRRSFFHAPYKRENFVLNTEELATIYHFPGSVAQTPTFKRIEAKKVQAPSNIPI